MALSRVPSLTLQLKNRHFPGDFFKQLSIAIEDSEHLIPSVG